MKLTKLTAVLCASVALPAMATERAKAAEKTESDRPAGRAIDGFFGCRSPEGEAGCQARSGVRILVC